MTYKTVEGRFNFRVAGLLVHEDKLLVMKDVNQSYYYIPGGRVKLHEQSEEAIKRELLEELSMDVRIKRLLWVNENFFVEDMLKEKFHEICFYYLLELTNDQLLKNGEAFVVYEDEKVHHYLWKHIDCLSEIELYPLFLKEKIRELPRQIEHIVER